MIGLRHSESLMVAGDKPSPPSSIGPQYRIVTYCLFKSDPQDGIADSRTPLMH
jgi:hypothetical protein